MSAPARLGKNRDFNVFLVGQTVSHVGHALLHVALPLLVLETTGSVSSMGVATACVGVGRFAGALVAGPVVDRVDRRRFMLLCDIASVFIYAVIPLWWSLGFRDVWVLYSVAFAGQIVGNSFYVAQMAALPSLVDRAQLTAANGRLMAGQALAVFVGPLLAGTLYPTLGGATTIGIDAITFVVSALSLLMIRFRAPREDSRALPYAAGLGRKELLAGIRFVWQEPTLRALLALMVAWEFLFVASFDLFIFHLKNNLGQGDMVVGAVFAIASLGAIVGSVLASTLRGHLGLGVSLMTMLVLQGVSVFIIGGSGTVAVIVAAASGFGLGSAGWFIYTNAIRQELTPEALLGRVTAAFSTCTNAVSPLGAAVATLLAEHIGVVKVMIIMAAGYVVTAMVLALTPLRQRHALVVEEPPV